jgi:transcriptional regulator with XRE-family HTH domain
MFYTDPVMTESVMNKEDKHLLKLIGRRVTNARKMRKMKQSDLADACGKITNTISNIERGCRDIKITTLSCVASALGVPLPEFVVDENPKKFHQDLKLYGEIVHNVRKLGPNNMQVLLKIIKTLIKDCDNSNPIEDKIHLI